MQEKLIFSTLRIATPRDFNFDSFEKCTAIVGGQNNYVKLNPLSIPMHMYRF